MASKNFDAQVQEEVKGEVKNGERREEEKRSEIVIKFVKDNCGLSVINEQGEFYEVASDF